MTYKQKQIKLPNFTCLSQKCHKAHYAHLVLLSLLAAEQQAHLISQM